MAMKTLIENYEETISEGRLSVVVKVRKRGDKWVYSILSGKPSNKGDEQFNFIDGVRSKQDHLEWVGVATLIAAGVRRGAALCDHLERHGHVEGAPQAHMPSMQGDRKKALQLVRDIHGSAAYGPGPACAQTIDASLHEIAKNAFDKLSNKAKAKFLDIVEPDEEDE